MYVWVYLFVVCLGLKSFVELLVGRLCAVVCLLCVINFRCLCFARCLNMICATGGLWWAVLVSCELGLVYGCGSVLR